MNQSMNDGGDCRTATGTPGLLNTASLVCHLLIGCKTVQSKISIERRENDSSLFCLVSTRVTSVKSRIGWYFPLSGGTRGKIVAGADVKPLCLFAKVLYCCSVVKHCKVSFILSIEHLREVQLQQCSSVEQCSKVQYNVEYFAIQYNSEV